VTGFQQQINHRIASVRESLRQAAAGDDDYLVSVHVGELQSLARLAADHGVDVHGIPETLAEHGVAPTADSSGQVPATAPIDLRSL